MRIRRFFLPERRILKAGGCNDPPSLHNPRRSSAALAHAVVTDERLWDGALAEIDGLEEAVTADLDRIDEIGMYEAMKECAE